MTVGVMRLMIWEENKAKEPQQICERAKLTPFLNLYKCHLGTRKLFTGAAAMINTCFLINSGMASP